MLDLNKLYHTNNDFHRYVETWRSQTGESVSEVLQYITVKEYAKYVQEQANA